MINLKYSYILLLCLLTACENKMGSTTNDGKLGTKVNSFINKPRMNIDWTIDGSPANGSGGQLLQDQGWHLITMTVVDAESKTIPVEVKGILSAVYPKPDKDVGQEIPIVDVNCKDAIFSKVGDSCSAYARLAFDETKAGLNKVPFNIQMAPAGNITALLSFSTAVRQDISIGNIRPVLPSESKYYTGSTIISNKLSYRILLVQNNSHFPFSLTTLNQTSSTFDLMHRTSNSESDPIYGKYPECSLTANEKLLQVNALKNLYDSCLLIYKAPATSSSDIQTDTININSDANYTFPSRYKKFRLKARYENGVPIPSQTKDGANFIVIAGKAHPEGTKMRMDTLGSLAIDTIPSANPFKTVNLDYTFLPRALRTPRNIPLTYGNYILNIDEENYPSISSGTQILTDASKTNPVVVGEATLVVNAKNQGYLTTTSACGSAFTRAWTDIDFNVDLTRQGLFRVKVETTSNALCGNWDSRVYEANIPFNGYDSTTVYNVNQRGCGGGNWDIGSTVAIRANGCNEKECSITTEVMSEHNGVGDQCRERNINSGTATFNKPQVYLELSKLSNFTFNGDDKKVIALGGQTLKASIGGQSDYVEQTIKCNFNDIHNPSCHGIGSYNNGLSSNSMTYITNLLAEDALVGGTVDFIRSSGYDLADFIISAEE